MELHQLLTVMRLGVCLALGIGFMVLSIICGTEFSRAKHDAIVIWLACCSGVTFCSAIFFLCAATDIDVVRTMRQDDQALRAFEKIQAENDTETFDDPDSP